MKKNLDVRFYRRILSISLKDNVGNDDILRTMGTEKMLIFRIIKREQVKYRRSNEDISKT